MILIGILEEKMGYLHDKLSFIPVTIFNRYQITGKLFR